MYLTPYRVAVFVHLVAAFLMVGGNTVARIGLTLMRSSSNASEALGAYRTYAIAPRIIVPAVAVTVLTGIGAAWYVGVIGLLWAWGSVTLWVLLNIWRVVVVLPPSKVLSLAAEQTAADPVTHGPALLAAARQPRLNLGYLGMELVNVVIITLMVFKPA